MKNLLLARKNKAAGILKKMEKRNFTGVYVDTKEEALNQLMAWVPKGSTIAMGGSVSIGQIGATGQFLNENFDFIDRNSVQTFEEKRALIAKAMLADTFLTSVNALTQEGELVNVDGVGNRVALMAYGPDQVIVIAGMNKVEKTLEAAIDRARNVAAPANAVRLNLKTPCSAIGICFDCHSDDCICASTVVTRHSKIPGRIKVILVGEGLGY